MLIQANKSYLRKSKLLIDFITFVKVKNTPSKRKFKLCKIYQTNKEINLFLGIRKLSE